MKFTGLLMIFDENEQVMFASVFNQKNFQDELNIGFSLLLTNRLQFSRILIFAKRGKAEASIPLVGIEINSSNLEYIRLYRPKKITPEEDELLSFLSVLAVYIRNKIKEVIQNDRWHPKVS